MTHKKAGHRSMELDVDFIGEQNVVTKEEAKQISNFIQMQKLVLNVKRPARKRIKIVS